MCQIHVSDLLSCSDMATPIGTNNLKVHRRHAANCQRYSGEEKPDTYRPTTKTEDRADTCKCPIWCRGYLKNETEIGADGTLKPKRVRLSLNTTTWEAAQSRVEELYKIGTIPTLGEQVARANVGPVTVREAGERYLESRSNKGGSLDPIADSTHTQYSYLINHRLIPYCEKNGITFIKEFEDVDLCQRFSESWVKQGVRPGVGDVLQMSSRKTAMRGFRAFLNVCVDKKWLAENGAKKVKVTAKGAENEARYGLELEEYQQLLRAPNSNRWGLTQQEHREVIVAAEVMRWCGLRISDAAKLNSNEVVPDKKGDGWNLSFIQRKTRDRCVVPLPRHVKIQLDDLPGRTERGVKYFFTCACGALRMRICALSDRAQAERRFTHHFSPHCLRHTFAIQHFNEGTPVELVSRWLGHKNVGVTVEHYRNWIGSSELMAEDASRSANARMLAKIAAMPNAAPTE